MGYRRFFEVIDQESGKSLYASFREAGARNFCKQRGYILIKKPEIWEHKTFEPRMDFFV
jgi:hypothetical protein